MASSETATQLLDAAQTLVQERGFNAFSYKDLASEIGIRTASIHYHFPSKADLAHALMERYLEGLEAALVRLDGETRTSRSRIKGFLDLYRQTHEKGVLCLCGSMASDLDSFDEETQALMNRYFERTQEWLSATLVSGRDAGEFELAAKPKELASSLLASLQGALIVARTPMGSRALEDVQRTFFRAIGL